MRVFSFTWLIYSIQPIQLIEDDINVEYLSKNTLSKNEKLYKEKDSSW